MNSLSRFALLLGCAALLSCGPSSADKQWAGDSTGGDPQHGPAAIQKYGCIACHTIDGIRESRAMVGPPLTRMAARNYLAGNLQNNPENLIHFIQHPREVHNDTAMPEMGVTDEDARDIAAYLYTFK
jgi:cytochrome c2